MSPNRKADLQRKLVLASVPKPPAGLADRIKREIPKQLTFDAEKERRRFSQSVNFNLRVAASIILMISSVYLCIELLSRRVQENAAMERAERILNSPEATSNVAPSTIAAAPATGSMELPSRSATPAKKPVAVVADSKKELDAESGTLLMRDRKSMSNSGTFVEPRAEPQPVAVAPPPPAAPSPAVAEKITVTAQAPMIDAAAGANASADFVREAKAADLSLGMPSTLFGIDIAERQLAKDNSTANQVQRFAAPATRPSRGVRLEAEAAPSPADATKQLVRVSIDLPPAELKNRAAIPPIASDATLTVDFDSTNVRSHRPIVGETSATERILVANTSATALYELEIEPSAGRRAVIATVTLRYTSVKDGKTQTITRTIRRSDVATSWERASKRMKATSLGATAGELSAEEFATKAKEAGLPGYEARRVMRAPAAAPPPQP
ncbi:MAG: hypothetical protein QOI24_3343 [Acidobacteriota bacterium]|jgi:hypothetical protein|nr:hypothetical protein [Acidobacteriota bacterium]